MGLVLATRDDMEDGRRAVVEHIVTVERRRAQISEMKARTGKSDLRRHRAERSYHACDFGREIKEHGSTNGR